MHVLTSTILRTFHWLNASNLVERRSLPGRVRHYLVVLLCLVGFLGTISALNRHPLDSLVLPFWLALPRLEALSYEFWRPSE